MSACAGSSTDASRTNRSRCRPASLVLVHAGSNLALFLATRVGFSSISPAWSRWIALGRIGFMSTQRREDRRLASCTDRAGAPGWVTTNSRRSDRRNQQRVRLVDLHIRFGSPLFRQAAQAEAVAQEFFSFSARPLPRRVCASPSSLAVGTGRYALPDGKVRWQKRFVFPARHMRHGLRF